MTYQRPLGVYVFRLLLYTYKVDTILVSVKKEIKGYVGNLCIRLFLLNCPGCRVPDNVFCEKVNSNASRAAVIK